MDILNDNQLNNIFVPIIQSVIEYAIYKAQSFVDEKVMSKVYGYGVPSQYERTYDFLDSWQGEKTNTTMGAVGTVKQDLSMIHTDAEMAQHTSPDWYSEGYDIVESLADIIFNGKAGSLFGEGWWTQPRDAWKPIAKEISNTQLEKWLREGFRQYGITIQKVRK